MSSADTEQATAPEAAEAAEEAPRDEAREALLAELREALGDAVVGSDIRGGDLWVRVTPEAWRRVAEVCRQQLGFDYFCFLSGIDWMPSPYGTGEKEMGDVDTGDDGDDEAAAEAEADAEPEAVEPEPATADGEGDGWQTGYAGGDTRFQVFARLYSTTRKLGVTFKADVDEDDMRLQSWVPVYRGADWHEREAWEMFGFTFEGHPNLRHIYLPAEFEGNPLRKDFPLLARMVKPWPGIVDVEPMPEEPEAPAAETPAETTGEAG